MSDPKFWLAEQEDDSVCVFLSETLEQLQPVEVPCCPACHSIQLDWLYDSKLGDVSCQQCDAKIEVIESYGLSTRTVYVPVNFEVEKSE